MSSRVLRKLQGEKELHEEVSDPELESDIQVSSGARRKQLNINRYDLLNQQSPSESEVKEDDNETEATNINDGEETHHESVKRRKKKKKKKSGKHAHVQRSSEDNADPDEVERSVQEINDLLGEHYLPGISSVNSFRQQEKSHPRTIFSIQHRHLNPNNELKRIFGSKIIQSEHKRKMRGGRAHVVKATWIVCSKENWPPARQIGLSMSLVETRLGGINYFAYEHSSNYRQIQVKFLEAVESLNPDNIVSIINEHPYHVDALIQLSDLVKISEDLAMGAELIERALFSLECAFHPLFNIAQGKCRLDYRRQENRAFYITLFKHLQFVGGRACYRTALELSKLLLSLDPDGDPLAIKLIIDFYALRSKEYVWLIELFLEWDAVKNLSQLPNFAYSVPLAYFHANEDIKKADALLQDALVMFPGILLPLLDKCNVQIDNRVSSHPYFGPAAQAKQSPALTQLVLLYVNRSYPVWKETDVLPWLEKNVHVVLDKVDNKDPMVKDYETKRLKRYQGPLPRNISRHILLSDVKGVSALCEDFTGSVLSFDPLPPTDSINIYDKPKRPRLGSSNSSAIGIFFRSLLPNFNVNEYAGQVIVDDDGARALPDAEVAEDVTDLRRSVASLVGAMRDLLSNIRLPDVPNEADVDENDDSEDEEEQNNYLT